MQIFREYSRYVLIIVFGILFLLLNSCSSTPKLAQQSNSTRNQALDYRQLAQRTLRNYSLQEAEITYRNALMLSQSIDHAPGIILSMIGLGDVYTAMKDFDSATQLYRKAERIAEENGLHKEKTRAKIALAELLLQQRDAEQVLHQLADLENGLAREDIELAMLYHTKGVAYRIAGDFLLAENSLNESIKLSTRLDDLLAQASSHYQLASVYSLQGDFVRAMKHAELSLQYDKQLENSMGIASSLEAIATIYERMSDKESSLWYLLRAQSVYQGIGNYMAVREIADKRTKLGTDTDSIEFTDSELHRASIWEIEARRSY